MTKIHFLFEKSIFYWLSIQILSLMYLGCGLKSPHQANLIFKQRNFGSMPFTFTSIAPVYAYTVHYKLF